MRGLSLDQKGEYCFQALQKAGSHATEGKPMKKHRYNVLTIRALAVLLALPVQSWAASLTVLNTSSSGPGSLSQAIQDAAPGDTIVFDPSVSGTILTSQTTINKNLTIIGPGAKVLTLSAYSGTGNNRVLDINGGSSGIYVNISGLTIANGHMNGGDGPGIRCQNAWLLTLSDCAISNNTVNTFYGNGRGGGLYVYSSTAILRNCTLVSNSAADGGALNVVGGSGMNSGFARLTNCTVAFNTAHGNFTGYGGGVNSSTNSEVKLQHCTITGNQADMGGGLYTYPGRILGIGNSVIAGNQATVYSAAASADCSANFSSSGYNLIGIADASSGLGASDRTGTQAAPLNPLLGTLEDNTGATCTIRPLTGSPLIDAGTAAGTVTDQRGRLRPADDPLIANAAGGDGSDIGAVETGPATFIVTHLGDSGVGSLRQAISDVSLLQSDNIRFAPGLAGTITLSSGGLDISKSLSISGPGAKLVTVSGNDDCRVFIVSGAAVSISGLRIANGLERSGAGIYHVSGSLTVRDCEITGNRATRYFGGGGIRNEAGNLFIINCILDANRNQSSDDALGGGLHSTSGLVSIVNSTISGNEASGLYPSSSCTGGGIAISGGDLELISCTICSNTAAGQNGRGGGVAARGASPVSCANTIIAGNAGVYGADVSGEFRSGGNNLILNPQESTGFDPPSDQFNVDPLLGALGDYGGPTRTHALRAGSPAIDHGSAWDLTTDQRGFPRTISDPDVSPGESSDGTDTGAFESDPRLAIPIIQRLGDDIILGAITQLGHNYGFQHRHDAAGLAEWKTVINNVPGTGYLLWITHSGAATLDRRFYRAVKLP